MCYLFKNQFIFLKKPLLNTTFAIKGCLLGIYYKLTIEQTALNV